MAVLNELNKLQKYFEKKVAEKNEIIDKLKNMHKKQKSKYLIALHNQTTVSGQQIKIQRRLDINKSETNKIGPGPQSLMLKSTDSQKSNCLNSDLIELTKNHLKIVQKFKKLEKKFDFMKV